VYPLVLMIHSWLRWIALLLGAAATINAFRVRNDETMPPRGRRWDWWFMLALDVQVLLGLVLYFGLSPFTRDAIRDVGLAMRDPRLRFFVFTHVAAMVVAIAAVRAGRVFAIGDSTSPRSRTWRYASFGIAWVAMAAGVPWPGLIYGRPLFRW
jgi:hypothetical protein